MSDEAKKIRILIADDSDETRVNLTKLLSLEDDVEVVGEARDGAEAIAQARALQPHVLLIDVRMPTMDGITATEAIVAELPSVQVIMMSVVGTAELLRRAMLVGAREYLVKPFDPEELVASVRRVYENHVPPPQSLLAPVAAPPPAVGREGPCAVVAVFGPKGGIGRTTVACNLAVALAAIPGQRVALVDACLRFGDVGLALGLQSDRSIADMAHLEPGEIDLDMIEGVMVTHVTGLRVLLAPPRPENGELVAPEAVRRVLQAMRAAYRYVVVDVSPLLLETDMAALDIADKAIVLYALEMTAVKDLKLFLELAGALGYPRAKMMPVVNSVGETHGVRLEDVEANLKFQTALCIPHNAKVAGYAMNKGIPFVIGNRETGLAKSIVDLARMLHAEAAPAPVPARAKAKKKKEEGSGLSFGRRRSHTAA